jgi:competence protein ComEA
MDLNTVTLEDLIRLPGVGPVMAKRVISWREQHGNYPSLEALTQVKGIKEKTLARLRPYLTISVR